MNDTFFRPFTDNEFLMRALVAGVLVAVSCAVVGTFVVLRGLAFVADALAHGVDVGDFLQDGRAAPAVNLEGGIA